MEEELNGAKLVEGKNNSAESKNAPSCTFEIDDICHRLAYELRDHVDVDMGILRSPQNLHTFLSEKVIQNERQPQIGARNLPSPQSFVKHIDLRNEMITMAANADFTAPECTSNRFIFGQDAGDCATTNKLDSMILNTIVGIPGKLVS